jgi:hypothetical protein
MDCLDLTRGNASASLQIFAQNPYRDHARALLHALRLLQQRLLRRRPLRLLALLRRALIPPTAVGVPAAGRQAWAGGFFPRLKRGGIDFDHCPDATLQGCRLARGLSHAAAAALAAGGRLGWRVEVRGARRSWIRLSFETPDDGDQEGGPRPYLEVCQCMWGV